VTELLNSSWPGTWFCFAVLVVFLMYIGHV